MTYGAVQDTNVSGLGGKDDLDASIRSTASRTKDKRSKNAASDFDVLMHLIKANIGTGMLALPSAFSRSGLPLGIFTLIAMAFIAVHCMILLVSSSQYLTKRLGLESLEYGQVTEMAFLNLRWESVNFGCFRMKRETLGKIGKTVVNIFLVITQFGFCIVYFVFVGKTLLQVSNEFFHVDLRWWIFILLVPYILLSWIREVRALAPLMGLANICIFVSLAVVLYDVIALFVTQEAAVNCVTSPGTNHSKNIVPASTIKCGVKILPIKVTDLFLFFGVAVYSYEGIGVVLPLENTMKKPQHFKPVVYIGMATVASMYLSVGLLGYMAYGNCVDSNVILSLHASGDGLKILFLIVQLLMGYVVYASFAIQFYVPMDFLEAPLMDRLGFREDPGTRLSKGKRLLKTAVENIFRGLVVTVLCGFALIEPTRLGDIISLVGAVASTALALTFPPIIHILTFSCGSAHHSYTCNTMQQQERAEGNLTTSEAHLLPRESPHPPPRRHCGIRGILTITKNVAITSLGVVGGIVGTYAAMNDLVASFTNPSATCH